MSCSHRRLYAASLAVVAGLSGSPWTVHSTATASSDATLVDEANSKPDDQTGQPATPLADANSEPKPAPRPEPKPEGKPELKQQPRLLAKPEGFTPPRGPLSGPPSGPPMGPPHAGGPGGVANPFPPNAFPGPGAPPGAWPGNGHAPGVMGPGGRGPEGRGPEGMGQGPVMGQAPGMGQGPGMMGRGMDWRELQRTDPELYEAERQDMELERKTFELVGQFRQARPEERAALKMAVQEVVAKHFEVRQKKRQLQLARMERDLKRMREEILRRDEAKDQIVGRRLKELIGDPGDLDF